MSKPTENELLDLDNFHGITNLEEFTTHIQILPSGIDVTDSVNYGIESWNISGDEFTIQLEPLYDRLDSIGIDTTNGILIYDTIYTAHRFYNVQLSDLKGVSFAGIDSLAMFFEVSVINSNPYYDTQNLLVPVYAVVQYQGIGVDAGYRNLFDLDELLGTDIKFSLRIALQISTGYNINGQFQFNRPIYKIRFKLTALSKQ